MNISELARQLKTEPQILLETLPKLGIDIGEKAIQINDLLAEKAKNAWSLHQRREKLKQKLADSAHEKEKNRASQKIVQAIKLPPSITVSDFAKKINIDVAKIIIKLMQEGIMAAMNQKIDYETAHIIAEDLGLQTELTQEEKNDKELDQITLASIIKAEQKLEDRPPVVVVMGHVDHGKTTLLDSIRKTNVAEGESGAITQHIGAYQVKISHSSTYQGKSITFIDTPGHEAFKGMRSRGGKVADIAVLVIAADDKIQPQTLESIEIIQKENLGLIVAINKIDKPESDIDAIKKQLSEINLTPEDWGGDVICVPVSAKQNKNINELLENILLLAEIKELKASAQGNLFATIIEADLDQGLGPVASAIIQNGTLRRGDLIKCNECGGRLKGLLDYQGHRIDAAGPSMPVKLLGLKTMPQVGDVIEKALSLRELKKFSKKSRLSLNETEVKTKQEKTKIQIKIHLKADALGTLEALISEISKIKHELVDIKVVKNGLGNFTESDALDAEAQKLALIGFRVEAGAGANHLINTRNIKFKTYTVIYKLLEDLRDSVEELIPPKIIEEEIGEIKILAVFTKSKNFQIIGGQITRGEIAGRPKFRIFRNNEVMGEGLILELQHNKEVVKKAKAPQECGLKIKGDLIVKVNDILRFYTTREEKRIL